MLILPIVYLIMNMLSIPSSRKEVILLDYIISFIISVMAGIVTYFIGKWLVQHYVNNCDIVLDICVRCASMKRRSSGPYA